VATGRGERRLTVRTVTIDLWGTLLVDPPGSDDRYRARRLTDFDAILRGAGHAFTMASLERAYQDSGTYLRRVWSSNRDVPVTDHVKAILRALDRRLADAAKPDFVAALVQAYSRPALLVPPAFDRSAKPALERLRADGLTLALISNTMRTPGAVWRQVLEGAGLLACFAHVTFSDELGVRKPSPEIFRRTLERIGAGAGSAVHVGDDPLLDVAGAREAGLRVVQVLGGGRKMASVPADLTITDLGELPAAIRSLSLE
jgi:HAD superfamily hydrolase (TIGR01509 family)